CWSSCGATRRTTWCATSSRTVGSGSSGWNRGVITSPRCSTRRPPMSHADSSPTGVIHNIGYRGYDGERLARRAITLSLYTHSLRGAFGLGRAARSKVVPIGMFVVLLLPAVVLAVVAVVGAGMGQITGPVVPYTRYAMIMQAALAIFVAVAAPQAVSLDLRFHSLPLYLARPLERVDYVRAKLAAT